MRICVTGGAGYIGSHAVKMLVNHGHDVVVVDNLSTGYEQAVDPNATFYNCSILETDRLVSIFQEEAIEAIMHFAAFSIVPESMKNPLKYYNNNVYGTSCLLEAMHQANVTYIIFSSTAAVYGEQTTMPITEDMEELPTNPYGQTKLAMEHMMHWAEKAYGIKHIALRYFNVAGAYHDGSIGEAHNPETHLIPLILQVPLGQREEIYIFGDDYDTPDGSCIRDYIHVEDLIDAHILAIDYVKKTNNSTYFNLGSGDGYSVKEMIEAARDVTNLEIKASVKGRREGDPARLIASSQKAKDILKWAPKYTHVKDIIKAAWQFHESHPNGYHND
ncbi:MAG: UDP-glucose 4-epimerase GalE [Candidatus Izemoplasma sp.]|nr:UDP-glucose 4-epimerase GalE [Candidatus Izemoplasma sp.]